MLFRKCNHMMQRCYNHKNKSYADYGGRGILVDKRWHNFSTFVDDMAASYQKGLELDRENNSLGYSKDNCRWVTHKEQCNNRRSNRLLADPNTGETLNARAIADRYSIPYQTIQSRLGRGYTFPQLIFKGNLKRYNHALD
jgi:hypothetical protein